VYFRPWEKENPPVAPGLPSKEKGAPWNCHKTKLTSCCLSCARMPNQTMKKHSWPNGCFLLRPP
jgi:hypothetical protein